MRANVNPLIARIAQPVEHTLGKGEVMGSIPIPGFSLVWPMCKEKARMPFMHIGFRL